MQRPQADSTADFVGQLLELRHPSQPSRRLPLLVRALLPDPLRSVDDEVRFRHADIASMTSATRSFEALRIRTAIALVDVDCVPRWLVDRLRRLEASG